MRKTLLLITVMSAILLPIPAQASTNISCKWHHTSMDDPIVFPGKPGMAHQHEFFGNTTTDAASTTASMHAGATTCEDKGDLAGYWHPSVLVNGVRAVPKSITAYYYRRAAGTITPFPDGFQAIAGDSHATAAPSTKIVYWGCGDGTGISKVTAPPDCTGIGYLRVHVLFPYCLNGSSLTYGRDLNKECPAGSQMLPQLVMRLNYPTVINATGIELSSGPYFTMHADYFSVWAPGALEALVQGL